VLQEFLTEVGSTDFAVAGWQAMLQRTHPPVALRLEALDDYEAGIAQQRSAAEAGGGETRGTGARPGENPIWGRLLMEW
jgi:hypothetical protein